MTCFNEIRDDFPILKRKIYGKPLVYLDNAATTQKPKVVLDKVTEFYSSKNSNVHRGVHFLGEEAGSAYASARESVRKFINSGTSSEIIFTHSTTDSINIAADPSEKLLSVREMRSLFLNWSIILILFHGKCFAEGEKQS